MSDVCVTSSYSVGEGGCYQEDETFVISNFRCTASSEPPSDGHRRPGQSVVAQFGVDSANARRDGPHRVCAHLALSTNCGIDRLFRTMSFATLFDTSPRAHGQSFATTSPPLNRDIEYDAKHLGRKGTGLCAYSDRPSHHLIAEGQAALGKSMIGSNALLLTALLFLYLKKF